MKKDKNIHQNFRLLELYQMLMQGETLQKQQLAEQYQVSEKTIQRDIECLREFVAKQSGAMLKYNRHENFYILEMHEKNSNETAEMVVQISRILNVSEQLDHTECRNMVEWLLMQVPPKDRYSVLKKIQQE